MNLSEISKIKLVESTNPNTGEVVTSYKARFNDGAEVKIMDEPSVVEDKAKECGSLAAFVTHLQSKATAYGSVLYIRKSVDKGDLSFA